MKKVYQIEEDDCWRCCIATILGLEAHEVPNFAALERGPDGEPRGGEPGLAKEAKLEWLEARGLGLVRITEGQHETYAGAAVIAGDGYHAVVMTDGEIWHDPWPEGAWEGPARHFWVITPSCSEVES